MKSKKNTTDSNISYEIYPPKNSSALQAFTPELKALSLHKPDFISVTCGAGGTANDNNFELCDRINNQLSTPCMAHLTCVGLSEKHTLEKLNTYQAIGIKSILALRGDLSQTNTIVDDKLQHAIHLCELIEKNFPQYSIYVAGYPEGHPESSNQKQDFHYQLAKARSGASGIITQLFFDNKVFLDYCDKMRQGGYQGKIIAGIFPITKFAQITKILSMSNAHLTETLRKNLLRYQNDPISLNGIGIDYAIEQIRTLMQHGHHHFHIYTMNYAQHITKIKSALN